MFHNCWQIKMSLAIPLLIDYHSLCPISAYLQSIFWPDQCLITVIVSCECLLLIILLALLVFLTIIVLAPTVFINDYLSYPTKCILICFFWHHKCLLTVFLTDNHIVWPLTPGLGHMVPPDMCVPNILNYNLQILGLYSFTIFCSPYRYLIIVILTIILVIIDQCNRNNNVPYVWLWLDWSPT